MLTTSQKDLFYIPNDHREYDHQYVDLCVLFDRLFFLTHMTINRVRTSKVILRLRLKMHLGLFRSNTQSLLVLNSAISDHSFQRNSTLVSIQKNM